jgi:hypothetical protein
MPLNCHICFLAFKRDQEDTHNCTPALQNMLETQKTALRQLRDLAKSQEEEKESIIKTFQQEELAKEEKIVQNLNILIADLTGKQAS